MNILHCIMCALYMYAREEGRKSNGNINKMAINNLVVRIVCRCACTCYAGESWVVESFSHATNSHSSDGPLSEK